MSLNPANNYLDINRKSWNTRLESHLESDFYDLKGFLSGASSLNSIELDLLGDIQGKSILHLQCHFGQDSISLSRLGAKVTGVDLSDQSIEEAKILAKKTHADAKFICCDLYELPKFLSEKFDIVFTTYGTISWMPDLSKWAKVIQHFLKPNGEFVFAEFHPFIWMFDDDIENIIYPYHNVEPIVEIEEGTYAKPDAKIKETCITWNHSIGEVISSLINNELRIESLLEYNYSPYPFVKNCEEYETSKFRIKAYKNNLPLVYSIKATKP